MWGPSTSSKECVVAIIADTAFHNLHLSLPSKTATVRPCAPRNAHDKIEQQQTAVILLDCGLEVEKGLRMLRAL